MPARRAARSAGEGRPCGSVPCARMHPEPLVVGGAAREDARERRGDLALRAVDLVADVCGHRAEPPAREQVVLEDPLRVEARDEEQELRAEIVRDGTDADPPGSVGPRDEEGELPPRRGRGRSPTGRGARAPTSPVSASHLRVGAWRRRRLSRSSAWGPLSPGADGADPTRERQPARATWVTCVPTVADLWARPGEPRPVRPR